jgi:hypothetical protein
LIDPLGSVGLELEPAIYDWLEQNRCFGSTGQRQHRTAAGGYYVTTTGLVSAQLVDPASQTRLGPVVSVFASRGNVGVPSRVGVAFFHRLVGCRVIWELDQRTWCMEYP